MKLYGIVPAAGKGSRLSPLPFSKELFPLGYQRVNGRVVPSPVSQHLITSMYEAGVRQVYFIVNTTKHDIQRYYQGGNRFGMDISYLIQENPTGMVDAISLATPWIPANEEALFVFGMPDSLFYPTTMFRDMVNYMEHHHEIDIVLGIFPTEFWQKLGMVIIDEDSTKPFIVHEIQDKPAAKPPTQYAWGIAVWRKPFQQFLTDCVHRHTADTELVLSEVFMQARHEGMHLRCFIGEDYMDTGTAEELQKAIRLINEQGI